MDILEIMKARHSVRQYGGKKFGYNNATAVKYIRRIWEEIAGVGGLAYQEACMIPKTIFQSNDSKAEREQKEKLRYEERFTIIDKNGDVSSSA